MFIHVDYKQDRYNNRTKTMNIYQISQELLSIFDAIEENNGDITPELEEQLAITNETFKDKIKSYTNVIQMLTNDIDSIKEEVARLKDLQKSKEKTIERLKNIIAEAIETFGNSTKTGGKFIDYGTGKVSVRYTQAVEVEDDAIDRFVNRLITGLKWYSDNNQLDVSMTDPKNIIDYVNAKSPSEEESDIEVSQFDVKDIERLTASIDLDINIKSLIYTETGMNLLRALLKYNVFKVKGKADKKGIKDDAKNDDHFMPVYAKLVTNKSINIK